MSEAVESAKKETMPKIYKAISAVMGEVGAVGKNKQNKDQNYKYRGIDDVYNALNPVMSKHGIVIIPNIKERQESEYQTKAGAVWKRVILTMEYTIYCAEDGSSLQTTLIGEGSDNSDKATNKAMSAAMKYLLFQIFCIPTEDLSDDADGNQPPAPDQPKPPANNKPPAPPPQPNPDVITIEQCKRLFAIAGDKDKEYIVRDVLKKYGYESSKLVKKSDYDNICRDIQGFREAEEENYDYGGETYSDAPPVIIDKNTGEVLDDLPDMGKKV